MEELTKMDYFDIDDDEFGDKSIKDSQKYDEEKELNNFEPKETD